MASSERWIDGLRLSSLFRPPPQDAQQRKTQTTTYIDYFGQFTSEQFPEDIAELIRTRYPYQERRLFDDVLAMFVLHHPEHGHAIVLPIILCISDGKLVYDEMFVLHHPKHGHVVVLPIISSISDGTLVYDKSSPPFASFISYKVFMYFWFKEISSLPSFK